MRKILLAICFVGATHGALAADMPEFDALRGSFPEGLTKARVNWQGYYLGVQGGYGATRALFQSGSNDFLVSRAWGAIPGIPPNYLLASNAGAVGPARGDAGGFGAFTGYNWQFDDVVIGLETSFLHGSFAAASYSSTGGIATTFPAKPTAATFSSATMTMTDYGSLRARAGYAWSSYLPYVFGGVGFGSADIDRSVGVTVTNTADPLPPVQSSRINRFLYGYSAGFGIDVNLTGGLFLRGEYEYARFVYNTDTTINSVRGGLGYKF